MTAANPQFILSRPRIAETLAVTLLHGVGGEHEWWTYNTAAGVGHLRVPVTLDEATLIPPGIVTTDAGPTGPQRARTYPGDQT